MEGSRQSFSLASKAPKKLESVLTSQGKTPQGGETTFNATQPRVEV